MATMYTYSVHLVRKVSSAGPDPSFKVEIEAPSETVAKRSAEAQYPGYEARFVNRIH